MMRERGQKLSRDRGRLSASTRILKGRCRWSTQRVPALLAELRERYTRRADANVVDGLRVEWPERWFHVRVSQTEPIVRVICEQRGAPPQAALRRALDR